MLPSAINEIGIASFTNENLLALKGSDTKEVVLKSDISSKE